MNKITETKTIKSPVKIVVTSHYSGNRKMSEVFENVITEQIRKNLKKVS